MMVVFQRDAIWHVFMNLNWQRIVVSKFGNILLYYDENAFRFSTGESWQLLLFTEGINEQP